MKKKIITLLTITIIITLSLIFEKNVKERYRVDTNNSFNKNNTNIIYSAGTFKINPFNINEAVEEVDYIFVGKVDGGLHLLELNGSIELDDTNKDEIINNYKQQMNKSNIKLNTSERKRYKSKYEL